MEAFEEGRGRMGDAEKRMGATYTFPIASLKLVFDD